MKNPGNPPFFHIFDYIGGYLRADKKCSKRNDLTSKDKKRSGEEQRACVWTPNVHEKKEPTLAFIKQS